MKISRQPPLVLEDIPGVREALRAAAADEFQNREDAWLELRFNAGPFPLRPMRVRDYVILLRAASPFLYRAEPTLDELAFFLWILSPQFDAWCHETGWRKSAFNWLQSIEAFRHGNRVRNHVKFGIQNSEFGIASATEPIVKACFDYVDRMFLDRPPAMSGGVETGLHFMTGWMDELRSQYHSTAEEVWEMHVPQLFACLRAIRQRTRASNAPNFNARRDAVNRKVLRTLRAGASFEDLRSGKVKINFRDN